MDMELPKLQFDYLRRFGVEIEVNASDGKDHLQPDKMPEGIHVVGNIVSRTLGDRVEIKSWRDGLSHFDKHGIGCWLVKPDGSCGMEICSSVSKGWIGLHKICMVVDALSENNIQADQRCSLHFHGEINDLTVEELASVITYWIKCEPVFMDAFPEIRKNNKYCQYIGMSDRIQTDTNMSPEELIRFFGNQKYMSINTYHLNKGKRPTMEFRIADGSFCTNSYFTKNWIRLLIHFIEMTRKLPIATKYVAGDSWSSYLWLDPKDVFKVLGWDGSYFLSPGMVQVKNWFLAKLVENLGRSSVGIMSLSGRRVAHTQVFDMVRDNIKTQAYDPRWALNPPDKHDAVYNKIYRI